MDFAVKSRGKANKRHNKTRQWTAGCLCSHWASALQIATTYQTHGWTVTCCFGPKLINTTIELGLPGLICINDVNSDSLACSKLSELLKNRIPSQYYQWIHTDYNHRVNLNLAKYIGTLLNL